MCLRGSRSSRGRPALPMVGEGDTEIIEGRVGQYHNIFEVTCLSILFIFCTRAFLETIFV